MFGNTQNTVNFGSIKVPLASDTDSSKVPIFDKSTAPASIFDSSKVPMTGGLNSFGTPPIKTNYGDFGGFGAPPIKTNYGDFGGFGVFGLPNEKSFIGDNDPYMKYIANLRKQMPDLGKQMRDDTGLPFSSFGSSKNNSSKEPSQILKSKFGTPSVFGGGFGVSNNNSSEIPKPFLRQNLEKSNSFGLSSDNNSKIPRTEKYVVTNIINNFLITEKAFMNPILQYKCSTIEEFIEKYPIEFGNPIFKQIIFERFACLLMGNSNNIDEYLEFLIQQQKIVEAYKEYQKKNNQIESNQIKEYFINQAKINEEKFKNSISKPINENQQIFIESIKNHIIDNNLEYVLNHELGKFIITYSKEKSKFCVVFPSQFQYMTFMSERLIYNESPIMYDSFETLMYDFINFESEFKLVENDLFELKKYDKNLWINLLQKNKLLIIKKKNYEKYLQLCNQQLQIPTETNNSSGFQFRSSSCPSSSV